jgi:DNA-directed RNA polymerase specialized sigma subunit
MRAALFGKRRADGVQDWENRIAFSGEQDFEHLLKTAVPLVRPLVRRMKRRLPRNFEADDLESVAVTGLFAAARNLSRFARRRFCRLCDTPNSRRHS